MKYGTAATKSNVCFFLYGIVLCPYIDSKNSLILQKKFCENRKLQKLEPPKNGNSTLGHRPRDLR